MHLRNGNETSVAEQGVSGGMKLKSSAGPTVSPRQELGF